MRTAEAVRCSAVLFDLDGTLVDSEPNYEAAGMWVFAIPTLTEPPLHPSFYRAHRLWEGGMKDFRARDLLAGIRPKG